MIIIARAILTGFVAGSSLGPVAMWGGQLRRHGYRDVVGIILGASVADIVLGVALVLFARRSNLPLETIKAFFGWATIPGLFIIGAALGFMAFQPVSKKKWPQTLRFAASFVSTIILPNTAVFVAGCLIEGWHFDDDVHVFLPLFAAGVILAWMGNVQIFHWLQGRATLVAGAVGAGCVLFAFVETAAIFV